MPDRKKLTYSVQWDDGDSLNSRGEGSVPTEFDVLKEAIDTAKVLHQEKQYCFIDVVASDGRLMFSIDRT